MKIETDRRPTAEEISALKGCEFTMTFTEDNGKELCGLTTSAYVAQADINAGITIMGTLPHVDGCIDHEEDVILQCCNRKLNNYSNYIYTKTLWQYIDMIMNNTPYPVGSSTGRDIGGMASACAF